MKKCMTFVLAAVLSIFAMGMTVFAAEAPAKAKAMVSDAKVAVNGADVSFGAYTIDGYTYFKLRDVAAAVKDTAASFAVGYNKETRAIALTTATAYTDEAEAAEGINGEKTALLSGQAILVDGVAADLMAYNIDGYNYFKLRDLGDALGFKVTWDNEAKRIGIATEAVEEAEVPALEEEPVVEEEAPEAAEVDLYELFTLGFASGEVNEEGFFYYYAANEDISISSMLAVNEDLTESWNVTGETVENEDGYLTIYDALNGSELTFFVEQTEENSVLVTFADGIQVELTAIDPALVVDAILAVDAETEVVS